MLRHAEIAPVQRAARGWRFLRIPEGGPSRMLFVLLDIAGLRADTREILIAVQKTFRTWRLSFSREKTSTRPRP